MTMLSARPTPSFNGAATLQSRKLGRQHSLVLDPSRFNGAATLQSRKHPMTSTHRHRYWQLQWGRDTSVAETFDTAPTYNPDRRLQWGRDTSVAETGTVMESSKIPLQLQWGRDTSVAETSLPQKITALPLGFNGAATLQSRKLAMPWNGGAFRSRLQWGRDTSVAETHRVDRAPRGSDRASMGPRHFSRGNRTSLIMVPPLSAKLQWGRDTSVAETRHCNESSTQ